MQAYGKKIKRSKNLYRRKKTPVRKTLEIIGMLVVVAGLAVIGYAAGKPLIEFISNGGGEQIPEDTLKWTPPQSDVLSESAPSNTEPLIETTEPEPVPEPIGFNGTAVYAPSSALSNSASLAAYLQLAKTNGYGAVVVELKDSIGNVWYRSSLTAIKDTDCIKGSLSLKEITDIFNTSGIKPIARLNTLLDQTGVKFVENMSYRFADGSYSWLDARIENGGKQWANPFLTGTRSYIAGLVKEIAKAGFSDIILANNIFPDFQPYDLTILAPEVTNISTRYSALTTLVGDCDKYKSDAGLMLEMSLKDVVVNYAGYNRTAELLRGKSNLNGQSILLVFNRLEIGTELTTGESSSVTLPADIKPLINTLFKQAARNLGDLKIIPCIDDNDLNEIEIAQIKEQLTDMGYDNYIIR